MEIWKFFLWRFQSLRRILANKSCLYRSVFPCKIHPNWTDLLTLRHSNSRACDCFLRITAFYTINIQCWFLILLLTSQSIPFQPNIAFFVIQQLKSLLDFPFKTLACFRYFLFSRNWFCHIVNPFFFSPLFFLGMDMDSELCWSPTLMQVMFSPTLISDCSSSGWEGRRKNPVLMRKEVFWTLRSIDSQNSPKT